jgi:hypothetical protein
VDGERKLDMLWTAFEGVGVMIEAARVDRIESESELRTPLEQLDLAALFGITWHSGERRALRVARKQRPCWLLAGAEVALLRADVLLLHPSPALVAEHLQAAGVRGLGEHDGKLSWLIDIDGLPLGERKTLRPRES